MGIYDVFEGGSQPFDKAAWIAKKNEEKQAAYELADSTADRMKTDGDTFRSYLDVQGRFDRYSVTNAILVAAQKPDATQLKDYKKVVEVYNKIALVELNYRGMSCEVKDVLKDTIKSCLCIISKGGIIKSEYNYYIDGIRRIAGHIYNENFNGEKASFIACKVLYLVSCIYTESDYIIIKDWDTFKNKKLSFKGARSVNYIKKVNMESYAYLCSTINLLGDEIEEIVEC